MSQRFFILFRFCDAPAFGQDIEVERASLHLGDNAENNISRIEPLSTHMVWFEEGVEAPLHLPTTVTTCQFNNWADASPLQFKEALADVPSCVADLNKSGSALPKIDFTARVSTVAHADTVAEEDACRGRIGGKSLGFKGRFPPTGGSAISMS